MPSNPKQLIQHRLYLIDSSIYVFKGWQTFPASIQDADNNPANAVHGFAQFTLQLFEQENPQLIAFGFDESRQKSKRREIYPKYKANRPSAPEELKRQFSYCRQWLTLSGLSHFADDYLEADDIIGTFSEQARNKHPITILSADKDLTQFVGKEDEWWDHQRKNRLSFRDIEKRWKVKPHQIADLLALSGDSVDNIPGIPGVGLSTAARLLIKWGNLTNLFDHVDEVKDMRFRGAPHICELLKQHKNTVELSRQLTGLLYVDGLPEIKKLIKKPYDVTALSDFMSFLSLDNTFQNKWISALNNSCA